MSKKKKQSKQPKDFGNFLDQMRDDFLKSEGKKYWTQKREAEFWTLPSHKSSDNKTKKQKATNKARRKRQSNMQRGEKRYKGKNLFALDKEYIKHKEYFKPKPQKNIGDPYTIIHFKNEMIFGDNVADLVAAAEKPNIKEIITFDATSKKKGKAKVQISSQTDIKKSIKDIKEHFETWTNYRISVIEKDDRIIILVLGTYED